MFSIFLSINHFFLSCSDVFSPFSLSFIEFLAANECEKAWGTVFEVVEPEALAAACIQQARQLKQLSPKGLRLTKWLLNSSQD